MDPLEVRALGAGVDLMVLCQAIHGYAVSHLDQLKTWDRILWVLGATHVRNLQVSKATSPGMKQHALQAACRL